MSNEDDFGSEDENTGVQPDKNHLLQELFGEGSSEEEEQPTQPAQPPDLSNRTTSLTPKTQLSEFKRPLSLESMTPNKPRPGITPPVTPVKPRKRSRSIEESPPGEDDNIDNEPLSILPAFSSSIDNQEDLIIEEEQEIRVEEMPYIKPPEDSPLHYFKLAVLGIEPRPFPIEEKNFQMNEADEPEKKKKKGGYDPLEMGVRSGPRINQRK